MSCFPTHRSHIFVYGKYTDIIANAKIEIIMLLQSTPEEKLFNQTLIVRDEL